MFKRKKNKLSFLVNWRKFGSPRTFIFYFLFHLYLGNTSHNWTAWQMTSSVWLWHCTEWYTRTFWDQHYSSPCLLIILDIKTSNFKWVILVHFFWLNGCVRCWCSTVPFTHQCLHYVTWRKQDIIFSFLVEFTTQFLLPKAKLFPAM